MYFKISTINTLNKTNKKNKKINKNSLVLFAKLFILFLILCVVFAGCSVIKTSGSDSSSAKCNSKSDCPNCFNCVSGKCVKQDVCCGDKVCTANRENECSCPSDCGQCTSSEKFIKKSCNTNNECVSEIDTSGLTTESKSIKFQAGNSVLSIIPSYPNPFLLGISKLNIRIKPDILEDKTTITIKRIKVYEKLSFNKVLVSEKDINQILYTIKSEVNEPFILEIQKNSSSGIQKEQKNLIIEVLYVKSSVDYSGKTINQDLSYEFELPGVNFVILPESKCIPSQCKDNNDCTDEFCRPVGTYSYCDYIYILNKACCGNKRCDLGEDKCSCPGDCGECNYDYGKYIYYSCNPAQKCVPTVKTSLVEQKSKIFNSISIPELKFETKIFYTQPLDLKDSFKIEMTLNDISSSVIDSTIQSIQLLESEANLLGEISVNEAFYSVGTKKTYILQPNLLSISDAERALRPRIVINFKYSTKYGEDTKINLAKETISLDEIYFVKVK